MNKLFVLFNGVYVGMAIFYTLFQISFKFFDLMPYLWIIIGILLNYIIDRGIK